MPKVTISCGDKFLAPYVLPHPTLRHRFTHEMRPAVAVGFSHPAQAARDWGWRGDVLVRFADGVRSWVGYPDVPVLVEA